MDFPMRGRVKIHLSLWPLFITVWIYLTYCRKQSCLESLKNFEKMGKNGGFFGLYLWMRAQHSFSTELRSQLTSLSLLRELNPGISNTSTASSLSSTKLLLFYFFRPINRKCHTSENFDTERLLEKTAKMPLVSKQTWWERKKGEFSDGV